MSASYLYSSLIAKIFATGVAIVSGLVTLKLVAEYLTVTQFGLFMVAAQLLAYLPFFDGGLRMVINRELLAGTEESRHRFLGFAQRFYSWFGLMLAPVVILMMTIYWLTPNANRAGEPLILFIAIGLSAALQVFAFAQANLLVGLQSQGTLFWLTGISNLAQLFLLFVGFKMGFKLWAYPFANALGFLLFWPLIALVIRQKEPKLRLLDFRLDQDFWQKFRSLRSSALNSFLSQIAILLLFTVDLIIVGMVVSLEEAAVYALLVRVLSIVRSFIQSIGEVSWPVLAKNSSGNRKLSRVVLHLNAWIYGSVGGALAVFLLPLLESYMGSGKWVGSDLLFSLLLARFIIVGLQSPAGYFLISAGKFGVLARVMWRELLAALVLSGIFLVWHGIGVALGFLISTAFGTMYHIFAAYAQSLDQKPLTIISSVWSRALAGGAASLLMAWLILPIFPGVYGALGGAIGALIGILIALIFAALRGLSSPPEGGKTWQKIARFI